MAKDSKSADKPKRRKSSGAAKEHLEEAKAKGRQALARLQTKMQKQDVRAGLVAIGANVAIGFGHRWLADRAEVKAAGDEKRGSYSRERGLQVAKARQDASMPHVAILGEAGTYAAASLALGLATGNRDLLAAGIGLTGTESYLRARGAQVVDKAAMALAPGVVVAVATDAKYQTGIQRPGGGSGGNVGDDAALPAVGYDDADDATWIAGDDDDDATIEGVAQLEVGAHPADDLLAGLSDDDLADAAAGGQTAVALAGAV